MGVVVSKENCKGCKQCEVACPLDAIHVNEERLAVVDEKCVECGVCTRVCKFDAVHRPAEPTPDVAVCSHCSVQCKIPEGQTGGCKRYTNEGGKLVRNRALVVKNNNVEYPDPRLLDPLITAVGAGTNYPCIRPAPHIVCDVRDGVEVVTVVTEAPLSYSGVKVKLDTNTNIGEEGDPVFFQGKEVGMIDTEEYGSKMLTIGGANHLTGATGFATAECCTRLANGDPVELSVKSEGKKTTIACQLGKAPVIDGQEETLMRIGCGSATIGLLADIMKEGVDECIVIDHHVTGLFSEHLAGAEVGMEWSGIVPNATKSTRGRYFGGHGDGIGGTSIMSPRDAIKEVDMSVAKAGMKCLVTNTTGEIRALFEVQEDGDVKEIDMTPGATAICDKITENCQRSTTSVIYVGGTGGSARGGVCHHPVKITEAVHAGKAVLTIGGAPAFILPGGGINFMVDAGKVVTKAFTWVPTPATVAPVEYTITKADYEAIGGHMNHIRPVQEVIDEYAEK